MKINYLGGMGEPLLMIHGWGVNSEIWISLIDELKFFASVYVVDLPGMGDSSSISPYTLDNLANAFPPSADLADSNVSGATTTNNIIITSRVTIPTTANHKFKFQCNTTSVNFNKSLSSAFFIGLSLLVAIVFLYILFVMCKANTQGSIFVLISFVFISLANPYIFNIDFSIFSSAFTPSVGYGYLPLIYVPRGAVSYLLIPIILSLVYKNNKLLIASLVLAGLIHLGYSVIYTSIVLVASIVNSFIFKEENKNVYMIIGLLLFLVLVMISQSIYSTESIVTINFGNLNFSDLKLSLNFSTIAFYLVLLLLLFLSLSKPIKKYIVMIFIVNIFLEALLFFELTGILNSDSISQRMAGSFSYLVISMFTLVILYIVNNFNKMYKNNKLTILILPAFLLWAYGLNHVYIINKLSGNSNIESYKEKLNQSYMKTSIVKSDITSYINKRYANENELYWLSSVNGVYYIDVGKIKRMNFEDLDIDNEFLVFLYLYIKST